MQSSSAAAIPPGLPALYRKRDLLLRFIPASLVLHAIAAAPWARVLVLLFRFLGVHGSPVHTKDFDAPTVIPIDLDGIDEGNDPILNGAGGMGEGPGPGVAGDAGTDAPGDGAPETGTDAAPALPPRVRDPNALAGGLNSIVPRNKEVNVSILLRADHMRTHPVGKELTEKLSNRVPEWKPFKAAGLDLANDIDVLWAFGPRFHENSRVTFILVHNKTDEGFGAALKAFEATAKGEDIVNAEGIVAFRAKIENAERVVVQIKSGVIVTPPDGEEQAMAIARQLLKKGKSAKDMVPKGDKDLFVAWYLRKPSNVYTAIPEDLTDVHVTLRRGKDDGLVADADAKAKDGKQATEDAVAIKKLVEEFVPKGALGYFAQPYVKGYKVGADGDVVHLHHALDGDQVNAIWTYLTISGTL
jgi:hypothetical protein